MEEGVGGGNGGIEEEIGQVKKIGAYFDLYYIYIYSFKMVDFLL